MQFRAKTPSMESESAEDGFTSGITGRTRPVSFRRPSSTARCKRTERPASGQRSEYQSQAEGGRARLTTATATGSDTVRLIDEWPCARHNKTRSKLSRVSVLEGGQTAARTQQGFDLPWAAGHSPAGPTSTTRAAPGCTQSEKERSRQTSGIRLRIRSGITFAISEI